jgi:tRNA threonylcarbamoyladenosine dehydratase
MMNDPYYDRFSGIGRLYGIDALEKFRRAHVLIVGIGGVGCWAAENLARSGIGHLTLIDADDLCVTNTNRQLHALDGTYGRPKVSVMAERLRAIQPGIVITERQEFFSERNSGEILGQPLDGVVDAIDSLRAKCHLIASCHSRKIPVVVSGAAGGRKDPLALRREDLARTRQDGLLLAVRKKLRQEYGFPKAKTGEKVKKFGVTAIFSEEDPIYPTAAGGTSCERPEDMPAGLRCDAGYGTVTHITAAFGMAAAATLLDHIAAG